MNGEPPGSGESGLEKLLSQGPRGLRVEVEFRISREEEAAAMSELDQALYPRWFRRGFFPVVLGLGAILVVTDLLAGDISVIRSFLAAAGLGVGLGLTSLFLDRRLGRHRWVRRVVVSPEGYREEPAIHRLTPWSRITSVRETPGFFLFSRGFGKGFRVLPKRVLSAPDIDAVRTLVQDNLLDPEEARLYLPDPHQNG